MGPETLGPGEAFEFYSEGDATGGFKQRDILFLVRSACYNIKSKIIIMMMVTITFKIRFIFPSPKLTSQFSAFMLNTEIYCNNTLQTTW